MEKFWQIEYYYLPADNYKIIKNQNNSIITGTKYKRIYNNYKRHLILLRTGTFTYLTIVYSKYEASCYFEIAK